MIRTQRIPFFQSKASLPVLVVTGSIMAAGIALPFTPLGAFIGLQPLPSAILLDLPQEAHALLSPGEV